MKMTTNMRVHLASENNSYSQFAEDLLVIGEGWLGIISKLIEAKKDEII
jgi:hypothetical protein